MIIIRQVCAKGSLSITTSSYLVKESNDFACHVLPPRLLVIHNPSTGGQDHVSELSTWQELDHPLFQISELDVVAWRDDAGLVEAAVQLDDNLAVAMVVNFFKLANVACNWVVSMLRSYSANVAVE